MVRVKTIACGLALITSGLLPALSACADGLMYRYLDDKGVVVIGYTLPEEAAWNGYDILNPDGSVRETIPKPLPMEEQEKQRSALIEQQRLREWDESLLLRYSVVADIEATRDRTLRELDIHVSILRGNIRALRAQIESNQSRAADIERSGRAVPADITAAIEGFKQEVESAETAIVDRKREIEAVKGDFQRDIARFEKLLDVVEIRRKASQ